MSATPEALVKRPGGLGEIQTAKREIIAVGEGRVEFDLAQAALALGVSQEIIKTAFFKNEKVMIVKGDSSRKKIVFEMRECLGKDLWEETLGTLERGRKEDCAKRDTVRKLVGWSRALKEWGDDEARQIDIVAGLLYHELPSGMQQELRSSACAPDFFN